MVVVATGKSIIQGHRRTICGYKILRKLGAGPLGCAYSAVDLDTGQRVALRAFRKPPSADPELWERAIAGFAAAMAGHASIDEHPAIQKVVRFGIDRGLFYVATEFLTYPTLREMLQRSGRLPQSEALKILSAVGAALDYAAEHGIVHPDLTPKNILVAGGDPAAIVAGFGIGHARDRSGSIYVAPEYFYDGRRGPRSHVFSAGVIAYEMIAGHAPFWGSSNSQRRRRLLANKPSPLSDAPPYVQQVLRKMMETDLQARYERVSDAVEDLFLHRKPAVAVRAMLPEATLSCAAISPQSDPAYAMFAGAGDWDSPPLCQFDIQRQNLLAAPLVVDLACDYAKRLFQFARPRIPVAAMAVVAAVFLLHAARARSAYETGTVVSTVGSPRLVVNGAAIPVGAGDLISSRGFQMLETGPASSITVAMRGCNLKLLPDTKVILRRLRYANGPDREFQLLRGSVLEDVAPGQPKGSLYETLAGQASVRAFGGRIAASVLPQGGVHVANLSGAVDVFDRGEKTAIPPGASITTGDPGSAARASAQTANAGQALDSDLGKLAGSGVSDRVDKALAAFEDRAVLPGEDFVGQLNASRSDRALKDARALQAALTSAHAIAVLIETSDNGETPQQLDLATLAPVSDGVDVRAALGSLDRGRLLSYTRVDSGRYEFTARAADSRRTLLRVHDGTVDIDDEGGAGEQTPLGFIERFLSGQIDPPDRD